MRKRYKYHDSNKFTFYYHFRKIKIKTSWNITNISRVRIKVSLYVLSDWSPREWTQSVLRYMFCCLGGMDAIKIYRKIAAKYACAGICVYVYLCWMWSKCACTVSPRFDLMAVIEMDISNSCRYIFGCHIYTCMYFTYRISRNKKRERIGIPMTDSPRQTILTCK